jgi:hypothetical protein
MITMLSKLRIMRALMNRPARAEEAQEAEEMQDAEEVE